MTLPLLAAPAYREIKPAASGTPRVSVLVPTYNTRAHIRKAVISLLNQTLHELEVLVVDDASTDGSTEALVDIGDPRLRVVRLERNVGPSGARNAGIALSRGDCVALLDADDVALPHRMEAQLRVLDARPKVGLVAGLVNRIDVNDKVVSRAGDEWLPSDSALAPLMLFLNPINVQYMLRRSAIPAHGFRPLYAEDYAMGIDVSETHEVVAVREALGNYRISPGGMMSSRLDQVAVGALSMQRRVHARLGMPTSDYDEALMRSIMFIGAAAAAGLTLDWLRCVRRLLDQVREVNQSTRVYRAEALAEALAFVWEVALLEATRRGRVPLGWRSLGPLVRGLSIRGTALRARTIAHGLVNLLPRQAESQ